MSFICQGNDCVVVKIGPRVKPHIVVAATRAASYECQKRDEEGDLIDALTFGTEIAREVMLCPTCAGVPVAHSTSGGAAVAEILRKKALVRGPVDTKLKDHRRGCKAPLHDCLTCTRYVEMAGDLPLPMLSDILEEPTPKHWGKVSMGKLILTSIDRLVGLSPSKRGAANLQATYGVLGPYQAAGGKL